MMGARQRHDRDFSPLPRLYRNAVVFAGWEGTYSILCEQVLRDLGRLDELDLVLERVRACLPEADGDTAVVGEALDGLALRLRRSLAESQLHFRRHLMRGYDPEADPGDADLSVKATTDM